MEKIVSILWNKGSAFDIRGIKKFFTSFMFVNPWIMDSEGQKNKNSRGKILQNEKEVERKMHFMRYFEYLCKKLPMLREFCPSNVCVFIGLENEF